MKTKILSWDWKEQPHVIIADFIMALKERGYIGHIYPVEDTGSDDYAIVMSNVILTPKQVEEIYRDSINASA